MRQLIYGIAAALLTLSAAHAKPPPYPSKDDRAAVAAIVDGVQSKLPIRVDLIGGPVELRALEHVEDSIVLTFHLPQAVPVRDEKLWNGTVGILVCKITQSYRDRGFWVYWRLHDETGKRWLSRNIPPSSSYCRGT